MLWYTKVSKQDGDKEGQPAKHVSMCGVDKDSTSLRNGRRSGATLHKHVFFIIQDLSEFQTIYSSDPVHPKH